MNALGITTAGIPVRSRDPQHRHVQHREDDFSNRIVGIDPPKGKCHGGLNSRPGVAADRFHRGLDSFSLRHDHGHGMRDP